MNGGIYIFFNQLFTNDDGILEVVTTPRHERHQNISSQSQFTLVGGRTVCKHITTLNLVSRKYPGTLVDTGVLVRPLKFVQRINIHIRIQLTTLCLDLAFGLRFGTDNNTGRINADDFTVIFSDHHRSGIMGHNRFHARSYQRCLSLQQRNCLSLHIRTHQGTVGVIVFEKGD